MPRFDIAAASLFQSRDGGITKGGLVRNGFTDVDGAKQRWANMRPSLATSALAPFTGSGLGLFQVGTNLYGVGNNGTAQSWAISMGVTPFTLNAGSAAGIFGYSESGAAGSLTPSTWAGKTVFNLLVSNGTTFEVSFTGSVSTNAFTRFTLNGNTFLTAQGSYGTTGWSWSGTPISGTGVYYGGYL